MGDEDQRDLRAGRRAQGELGDGLGLEARAALRREPDAARALLPPRRRPHRLPGAAADAAADPGSDAGSDARADASASA